VLRKGDKVNKRELVFVWHGHHQSFSPLEELGESFKEREDTINYQKSRREDAGKIARRKALFKRVKGGLKALPKSFQKLVERYIKLETISEKKWAIYVNSLVLFDDDSRKKREAYDKACEKAWEAKGDYTKALDPPSKAVLALHKKQCGCGWTPENNNIFTYKP
jgi:hypothetical protein